MAKPLDLFSEIRSNMSISFPPQHVGLAMAFARAAWNARGAVDVKAVKKAVKADDPLLIRDLERAIRAMDR